MAGVGVHREFVSCRVTVVSRVSNPRFVPVGTASRVGETDLSTAVESVLMSGKAKLVLVVALVAIVYVMVSSSGGTVEVPAE
jgi:hypothetical protein